MGRHTPSGFALACLLLLAACAESKAASHGDDKALEGDSVDASSASAVTGSDGDDRSGDGGDGLGGDRCARARIALTRLAPTVQVVVDASGSMAEPLGDCSTRWDCLRTALISDTGLITQLQDTVSFGLTLFGGEIAQVDDGKVTDVLNATCPRILDVAPALDNRDAIAMRYQLANPGGGTPTAEALQFVIDALPDPNEHPDTPLGPQSILLVTDGDPNACADPLTTDYEATEAQVVRAQAKGIRLYALTVADDQSRAHLQRMANLGVGLSADATPAAPYFEPSGAAELSDVLRRIIGGAAGCDVQLQGVVSAAQPGDECTGNVSLDGAPLECNGADGWRLEGPSTLVLQGDACDRFKFDPTVVLSADFPCDQVVLL